MRIIKLEIEVLTITGRYKIIKQAVGLNKKICRTIKQFKDYVIGICDLLGHYQIELDGFTLAPKDSIKLLREDRIYRLKSYAKRKVVKQRSLSQSVRQSSEEELSNSQSQEEELPVINQKKIIKSKVQQKKQKIKQKQSKKQNRNIAAQQSQQSQSQSSQSVPPVKKVKTLISPQKKPQNKKINQQIIKQKLTESQKKPTKPNIIKKKIQSSSSESQSSSLQNIPKKQQPKRESAIINRQKQIKNVQIHPKVVVPQKPKMKKVIIEESSESEPTPVVQRKPIKQIQNPKELQKIVKSPKIQNFKLPPALRNKNTNQFDIHKQNQWIVVDKLKYKKWLGLGHSTLCQPKNKIRFKIVELDQQKFIPVKSGWIVGQVNSVAEGGVVFMSNVEQEGKQFQKNYQIPEHNMDDLQIYRLFATKQQIECMSEENANKPEVVQIEQKIPQQNEKQNESVEKGSNSIEKFICGQINYYFSDKNYLTDFFMQLHANSDPEKYIKLGFMLNFPKIKKVLIDQQKLFKYLKQDEKYDSRSYEIDFERKLIRKRGIFDSKKMSSESQEKQANENNEQHHQEEENNAGK